MVNREDLAKTIIKLRSKKGYSQRKLAMVSGVSNSTISRIESATSDTDPETLKKLAPCLDISYMELMEAAGYVKEFSNITSETFKDEVFQKILPLILQFIQEILLKDADEQDKKFIEKIDIQNFFDVLTDNNDKANLFNAAIDKIKYQLPNNEGQDEISIYPHISIDKSLIPYIKEQYNKFVELYNENVKQNIKKDPYLIPEEFTNADEARAYVGKHQIFGSGGFDADRLDDDEILEFANALLEQMKMVSYKYKKN